MKTIKALVKRTKWGVSVFTKNRYGAYVDVGEYGMCQQKNACNRRELIRAGYHDETITVVDCYCGTTVAKERAKRRKNKWSCGCSYCKGKIS